VEHGLNAAFGQLIVFKVEFDAVPDAVDHEAELGVDRHAEPVVFPDRVGGASPRDGFSPQPPLVRDNREGVESLLLFVLEPLDESIKRYWRRPRFVHVNVAFAQPTPEILARVVRFTVLLFGATDHSQLARAGGE
jgi:hypothetical protein